MKTEKKTKKEGNNLTIKHLYQIHKEQAEGFGLTPYTYHNFYRRRQRLGESLEQLIESLVLKKKKERKKEEQTTFYKKNVASVRNFKEAKGYIESRGIKIKEFREKALLLKLDEFIEWYKEQVGEYRNRWVGVSYLYFLANVAINDINYRYASFRKSPLSQIEETIKKERKRRKEKEPNIVLTEAFYYSEWLPYRKEHSLPIYCLPTLRGYVYKNKIKDKTSLLSYIPPVVKRQGRKIKKGKKNIDTMPKHVLQLVSSYVALWYTFEEIKAGIGINKYEYEQIVKRLNL